MGQDPGLYREELPLTRRAHRAAPAREDNVPLFAPRACRICRGPGHHEGQCPRLRGLAAAVSLFSVPVFITDPINRVIWVNRAFAGLVGDPVGDRVPANERLIHLLVAGAYRDRFVQPLRLVASCLPSLVSEVEAGRLDARTMRVIDHGLQVNQTLKTALRSSHRAWNGVIEIRNAGGTTPLREQVSPVSDPTGRPTGFHICLWFPEWHAPIVPDRAESAPVAAALTPAQLTVARHYASGKDSAEVARDTGTSVKTARSHLEHVYSRLGINSRAQLATLLVREGLI